MAAFGFLRATQPHASSPRSPRAPHARIASRTVGIMKSEEAADEQSPNVKGFCINFGL